MRPSRSDAEGAIDAGGPVLNDQGDAGSGRGDLPSELKASDTHPVSASDEPVSRPHVARQDSVERDRRALGEIVASGEASDAEVEYYEWFADPAVRALDRNQRRRAGQYLRRLQRRWQQARHRNDR